MKIKRVSILGFKSFMERLDIDFHQGVSGVVGPNGCGKSNVVDAIRWCMGEQSPKQLRGRKMEDVIFNGAGNHKPLGMAEVSLLFSNGNGSFPQGFTHDELRVTRRLYRSGESEYLLNNMSCRLKDIQDVFMDTGLGNRAYSIIGQGQIGTIIEQRPEETRFMLEEAAGITKYRKKVQVSQRKIQQTEDNLLRVQDIQGEVQGQMRSLKRQAAKAARYKRVCEEIRNLELILYSNSFHLLEKELGEKSRSTDELERKEISVFTEVSRLHAKMAELNMKLEEKDEALTILRRNYSRLRDQVHKRETGIEALAKESKMLGEIEGRLLTEEKEVSAKTEELKRDKEKLQEKKSLSKDAYGCLQEELSIKDERLRARKTLLSRISEEYKRARTELNEGENKEVGLSHESGYLKKLLDQITDGRSRMEKEMVEGKAKFDNVSKISERKRLIRDATSERLQEIETAIERETRSFNHLEGIKKALEEELRSAETELNKRDSRLSSLESLSANFEGYKMGVRTIMKAGDFEPLEHGRVFGVLADNILVQSPYEEAVEAVLADKLQYVVVARQEDGLLAVDYLKEKEKGRSSFVSSEGFAGDVKKNRGKVLELPCLAEHVSATDGFLTVVNGLLEDVYIVENLDVAMSCRKKRKESGENDFVACFVTIEGDMVDERGVISGGKLSRSSSGLLARKREMDDLRREIVEKRENVQQLYLKIEDAAGEMEKKKGSLEMLAEDRWGCRDEINELDKMLFRLAQELDQLERLSRKQFEDLEKKEIEQRKHSKGILKIQEQLESMKVRREKENAFFQGKEVELKEAEEEYEALREEVSKIKAEQGIAQETQRSLIREVERVEEYMENSTERLAKIQEEISSGRNRSVECLTKKEALEEELHLFRIDLADAQQDMNHADMERRRLQDRIREVEKKGQTTRKEADELKDQVNRAKMEHSEIRFKIGNLKEVVRDKLNADLQNIFTEHVQENFSPKEAEEKITDTKKSRDSMGPVNLTAIKEHEALKDRFEFIAGQREDLESSIESLRSAIKRINRKSLEKFKKTFAEVDVKLKEIFPLLFNGGAAGLRLTDENNPLESGVLVEVQPPGKKLSHMGLLSGGEKALVAMALIFAIYMVKPSPFCLLDEVDAPLDEANIDRFNNLLERIKNASQVIMVTHSKKIMEMTDRLYGVTMEQKGVSKLVSVDIQNGREDRVVH